LELVEEEAVTVRRVFQLREEGLTLRVIAERLTDEGYKTKRGGKWYAGTVAAILDNVKYGGHVEYVFGDCGEARHSARRTPRNCGGHPFRRLKGKEEWGS
jgi:hypothetical protein